MESKVDRSKAINKTILVIMPNNPGDVIMALYALTTFKVRHPQTLIHYLVDAECQDLIINNPIIEKVWILPRSKISKATSQKVVDQELESLAELWNLSFYQSINFYQDDIGGLIQSLVKAEKKIGKCFTSEGFYQVQNAWARYLFAIPANRDANGYHVVDIYHKMLGLSTSLFNCSLPSATFLAPYKKYIVLQPGTAWPGKAWSEENWASLITSLLKKTPIVLIGAPQESFPLLETIQHPGLKNLVGKTSLIEVIPLLEKAKLLITADTFAMHVATCVRTKVISIFGASSPIETGPYGQNHIAIEAGISEDRNFKFSKKNHASLIAISPQKVLETYTDVANSDLISFNSNGQQAWKRKGLIREPHFHDDRFLPHHLEKVQQLENCLKICLHDYSQVHELETKEQALAKETQDSIAWETYRIAINSIPLKDIRVYLNTRLNLLQKMQTPIWKPGKFTNNQLECAHTIL